MQSLWYKCRTWNKHREKVEILRRSHHDMLRFCMAYADCILFMSRTGESREKGVKKRRESDGWDTELTRFVTVQKEPLSHNRSRSWWEQGRSVVMAASSMSKLSLRAAGNKSIKVEWEHFVSFVFQLSKSHTWLDSCYIITAAMIVTVCST